MAESLYYIYIIQSVLYCTAHGAVMQQPIFKCLGVMVTAKPALTRVVGNTCTVGTSGRPENCTMLTFINVHVPLVLLVMVYTHCTHSHLLVLTWMELCPWHLRTRLTHMVVQHRLWQGPVHQHRSEWQSTFVLLSIMNSKYDYDYCYSNH